MALPTLTPEQRTDALAKAAAARARRAEVKAALKGGSMRLSAFLEQADQEEVLGKMKALALLQSLPRVGATTARARPPLRLGAAADPAVPGASQPPARPRSRAR